LTAEPRSWWRRGAAGPSTAIKAPVTIAVNKDVFDEVFEEIEPGRYFLKIDVEWKFPEKIREARLVSYSSTNIAISRIPKTDGKLQIITQGTKPSLSTSRSCWINK
jgi:hypothetical protein